MGVYLVRWRCPVGNPIRWQGQRSAAPATLLPFISRNSITDVFSEFRAKQTREHRELDAMKFERCNLSPAFSSLHPFPSLSFTLD